MFHKEYTSSVRVANAAGFSLSDPLADSSAILPRVQMLANRFPGEKGGERVLFVFFLFSSGERISVGHWYVSAYNLRSYWRTRRDMLWGGADLIV